MKKIIMLALIATTLVACNTNNPEQNQLLGTWSEPLGVQVSVNAQTGNTVVNQPFTSSLNEVIANTGVYVLRIETTGGALVGQFVVQ